MPIVTALDPERAKIFKNRIEDVMTSAMKNLRTLVDVDIVIFKIS